jgi:hypothetical protein
MTGDTSAAGAGDRQSAPRHVCLAFSPEPESWSGMRFIAGRAGRDEVLAATEGLRHQVMVREVLGAGGRPERERGLPLPGAPSLASHLSHNWILRSPFLSDLVVTLARLLDGGGDLAIPDLRGVDSESLLVILALYRRSDLPRPILKLALGGVGMASPADERGIEWGVPSHLLQRFAVSFYGARLRAHSGVEILEGPPAGACPVATGWPATAALAGLSPGERLTRVRWWFFVHGFTSALREALALLAAEVQLAPAERAELLHLAGLAAHNRQFHSTPDQRLEGFLWSCFSAAYALEQNEERRVALCYRLAVVSGRRQKRFATGEEWARRGLALAASLPVDQAIYQRAWCGNLISFLLFKRGEAPQALAEITSRADELEPLIDGLPDHSPEDLATADWDLLTTRHVLANYGVMLSSACGERAAGLAWIEKMRCLFHLFPQTAYVDALTLVRFYRAAGEVRTILELSESSRRAAAAGLDFLRAFELTCIAGDQADRLGMHRQAAEILAEACALRAGLAPLLVLSAVDVPLAAVLVRAGQAAAAEEVLQALPPEIEAGAVSTDLRSEVAVLLACCAGLRGDREEARAQIDAAIAAAVESGGETVLVRCALAASEVARMLGDLDTASAALEQATDLLSRALAAGDSTRAGAGVRLICGLWETGQRGTELRPWTEMTIRHARQALREPECWPLLRVWRAVIDTVLGRATEDRELQEGLRRIDQACRERTDAAEG